MSHTWNLVDMIESISGADGRGLACPLWWDGDVYPHGMWVCFDGNDGLKILSIIGVWNRYQYPDQDDIHAMRALKGVSCLNSSVQLYIDYLLAQEDIYGDTQ